MNWEEKPLSSICDNLDNQRIPITKSKRVEGNIPYYGASGIVDYVNTHIFDENLLLVSEDGANLLARTYPIAFSVTGKTWVNNHAHVLRFNDSNTQKFVEYYLNSIPLDNFISGMAQPKLNQRSLNSILIPLPNLKEQKRIVAILDQAFADIEQVRAKTEQNLKNARELFESYLQQVFSHRGGEWKEKGLKEISIDFGRGKSKHRPRNHKSLYEGDYPFIQTGDVRNCEHLITNYSKTYNEKGLAQSKLWPKGTICITIAANIAETGILGFDACFPDSVIGIVVDPQVATIRYVEYLLQSFKTILKAKGQGSAQDNINMGTFEKMTFPFPSILKQDEIVNSLDGLMTSVQELENIYTKKLEAIVELKKSILQKAFAGELSKNIA